MDNLERAYNIFQSWFCLKLIEYGYHKSQWDPGWYVHVWVNKTARIDKLYWDKENIIT